MAQRVVYGITFILCIVSLSYVFAFSARRTVNKRQSVGPEIAALNSQRAALLAEVDRQRATLDSLKTERVRDILVGDPAECAPWTLQTLSQLAPGVEKMDVEKWAFEKALGLGYTVAPTHCLRRLAWDKKHLENVASRHDLLFFLHLMKTSGTSVRALWYRAAQMRREGICKWYNPTLRAGFARANYSAMIECKQKWHVGHVAQNGYHLKFREFRERTGFYLLFMRDPFMRAVSSYSYFKVADMSKSQFLTQPNMKLRRPYSRYAATYWATDIFWYLGVERIRSNDSMALQLEKLERAKFVIRSTLVLISERMIESLALISAVLGDEPAFLRDCVPPHYNDKGGEDRPLGLDITRHTTRVAMAKMRFARYLYEYAEMIFDLRLQQFGVRQQLQKRCNARQLRSGGFGHPSELTYMMSNDETLFDSVEGLYASQEYDEPIVNV